MLYSEGKSFLHARYWDSRQAEVCGSVFLSSKNVTLLLFTPVLFCFVLFVWRKECYFIFLDFILSSVLRAASGSVLLML